MDTKTKPMDPKQMPNKQNEPIDVEQELIFDDGVVQKIVGKTSADIDGVVSLEGNVFSDVTDMFRKDENPKKGVSVDIKDNKYVKVELDATMKYGVQAPKIFEQVSSAICDNVQEMTGLEVTEIKMTVKDMLTNEEIAKQEEDNKNKATQNQTQNQPN